ncbi:DUF760 domain-containing protein [Cronbergia sp. UHCC 0137]|uniref:DUF760 domain-containing protein n=1 Tax=Cronbergia sp. UHCC 0137 TaxID=3110239 RepID=UPI002B203945|nr:DUF760 domain-containing protein [Cronbergia sp. UHCC 0137]MEA5618023.1 DUF760 domain-containing protein [Cronbergia sp. UHCC 0137]
MSNLSPRQPDAFTSEENQEQLWEYLQSLQPEIVAKLSKPNSPEVLQLIHKTIVTMLGNLPNDSYSNVITTSREELGKLLGSAMVDGYFLRNVEQRLQMENFFQL